MDRNIIIHCAHCVTSMITVKDSMVLIHLAKTSLLENACAFFGKILIPLSVLHEIRQGALNHIEDVAVIERAIKERAISVKSVKDKALLRRANEFNIKGGEAEAVALYWQERAAWLATDDDNVRKKKNALALNVIGTPAIMIRLWRDGSITKERYLAAVKKLRESGWFSSIVYDVMLMEAR